MPAEVHPTAIVYPGTVLGEGVKILEHAVVGKQPSLSPRSTAKREPLPPASIGDGTIVSTGAIVFAGSAIGANCIVGDQSCIRERVTMADDCILGRGSLIENDTTVGDLTKIQAGASLVQLYTSFALRGPALIPRLKTELLAALRDARLACVQDAIGTRAQELAEQV